MCKLKDLRKARLHPTCSFKAFYDACTYRSLNQCKSRTNNSSFEGLRQSHRGKTTNGTNISLWVAKIIMHNKKVLGRNNSHTTNNRRVESRGRRGMGFKRKIDEGSVFCLQKISCQVTAGSWGSVDQPGVGLNLQSCYLAYPFVLLSSHVWLVPT